MSGAVSPAGDKHPGEIVYEDSVDHRKWTERAAEVPQTIAWVKSGEVWKPVVRIELKGSGEAREITTFGPNGEFLETTMMAPPPPPPAPSEPTPTPTPTPTKP